MSELDKQAYPAAPNSWGDPVLGLTIRQHAAIALRVPMSGDSELDAMIREARRLDMATAAMQAEIARSTYGIEDAARDIAECALEYADALLAASEPDYEALEREHLGDADKKTGIYATQPDAEGWIEWKGGECPASEETEIQFKQRDGLVGNALSGNCDWTHVDNDDGDIIAYRIVKE